MYHFWRNICEIYLGMSMSWFFFKVLKTNLDAYRPLESKWKFRADLTRRRDFDQLRATFYFRRMDVWKRETKENHPPMTRRRRRSVGVPSFDAPPEGTPSTPRWLRRRDAGVVVVVVVGGSGRCDAGGVGCGDLLAVSGGVVDADVVTARRFDSPCPDWPPVRSFSSLRHFLFSNSAPCVALTEFYRFFFFYISSSVFIPAAFVFFSTVVWLARPSKSTACEWIDWWLGGISIGPESRQKTNKENPNRHSELGPVQTSTSGKKRRRCVSVWVR